jgi:hypothetical protein
MDANETALLAKHLRRRRADAAARAGNQDLLAFQIFIDCHFDSPILF